jgi:hypothetical protein
MFKRPSVHYGRTPAPVTPYQKAAQAWDDRIGSARVQARNWRLTAFGSLILSAGLAYGLVWQSTNGTVTPWVVEVDRLGQAQSVSPVNPLYQPTDPQIAFHLARFEPRKEGYFNAVQVFPFSPGALYQIYAAPGQITDIALEPGEQLTGSGPVSAGDTVRWVLGDTESGSGDTRRVHIMVSDCCRTHHRPPL